MPTANRDSQRDFTSIILPGESRRRQKFFLSKAKLSHNLQLASFLAGFTIKSVANLQINKDASDGLLTLYAILTVLLAASTSYVILTTMWVLPLLKTSEEINGDIMDLLELQRPQDFDPEKYAEVIEDIMESKGSPRGNPIVLGLKTYRTNRKTIYLVEIAWVLAGTISIFLFTLDVITVCWIKFKYFTFVGVVVGTAILVSVMVGLGIFGLYFRLYFVRKFANITKGETVRKSQDVSFVYSENSHRMVDARMHQLEFNRRELSRSQPGTVSRYQRHARSTGHRNIMLSRFFAVRDIDTISVTTV